MNSDIGFNFANVSAVGNGSHVTKYAHIKYRQKEYKYVHFQTSTVLSRTYPYIVYGVYGKLEIQ